MTINNMLGCNTVPGKMSKLDYYAYRSVLLGNLQSINSSAYQAVQEKDYEKLRTATVMYRQTQAMMVKLRAIYHDKPYNNGLVSAAVARRLNADGVGRMVHAV